MTGYSLFFFLRVHYHIHRVFPKDPLPPIDALGPGELDYEFVKYGLQHWPWRSLILYGGLTLFTAWHVAEGLQIIYNTWFRGKGKTRGVDTELQAVVEKPKLKLTRKARLLGATLVTVPTFVGLWVIASEPVMAFSSFASRYHAIFTKNPVYRI
ncbi:hypothetical protein NLI96_g8395 [Meripilus lineatus]|uniref:Mitochondrial adapter protein MCP1 transmembrane domain-containing protein n=1 Tax=Meripilus lineatus TaxID=2056292 RepID=A0AAD5UXF8_9APHY|nr:hypothetical protein NLI96_g8395 [Physisporinus lineatus]